MGAMYGKYPLPIIAIKGHFSLSNGMYCVYGKSTEGLCVDVYRDSSMKKLVSMQHGITTNVENEEEKIEMLKKLIESMAYEF